MLAERLSVKPRVRFLGWRDDPAALFAAADVFICPSRHEPLGNVVIEAWAQAIPVIAAESQGPAALITNEKTGLLVPVDDADAMGAAIERLFRDRGLSRALGRAGRLAYEAEFTEAHVVRQYLDFFASVAR
jgi:glycosyltransferase involved in cell wall biosynthesis